MYSNHATEFRRIDPNDLMEIDQSHAAVDDDDKMDFALTPSPISEKPVAPTQTPYNNEYRTLNTVPENYLLEVPLSPGVAPSPVSQILPLGAMSSEVASSQPVEISLVGAQLLSRRQVSSLRSLSLEGSGEIPPVPIGAPVSSPRTP